MEGAMASLYGFCDTIYHGPQAMLARLRGRDPGGPPAGLAVRPNHGQPGEPSSLLVQFESLVVRYQELALWLDPSRSAVALLAVHLVFAYLWVTSCTALSLAAWAGLLAFVYTTWTDRVWPEIRVPPTPAEEQQQQQQPETDPAVVNRQDGVVGAKELEDLLGSWKNRALDTCVQLRLEQPKFFCASSCLAFALVGLLGTYVSAMSVLYVAVVGSLVVPGAVRAHHRAQRAGGEDLGGGGGDHFSATSSSTTPTTPSFTLASSPPASSTGTAAASSPWYQSFGAAASTIVGELSRVYFTVLPDIDVLQEQRRKLTEVSDLAAVDDEMRSFLPEEGGQMPEGLEEPSCGSLASIDEDNFFESTCAIKEASLVSGLDPIMPDHELDEPDSQPQSLLMPELHHPRHLQPLSGLDGAEDEDEAEDEFLPSASSSTLVPSQPGLGGAILLHQGEGRRDSSPVSGPSVMSSVKQVSSAAAAAGPSKMVVSTKSAHDDLDDLDDFEIISSDDLSVNDDDDDD